MDRALPEYNTVLHKKWNVQNRKLHKKKVQEQHSHIDNGRPKAYAYPIVKTKKEMIIEGKYHFVEKVF